MQDTHPPSGVLEIVKTTPLFSLVHGSRAKAVRRCNALRNSRFAWRSSSFRLTDSSVNKPIMATVIMHCATISTWTGQGNMGRGAKLTSNLPAVAGEATGTIESENRAHLCLSRSRRGDADALRKRTEKKGPPHESQKWGRGSSRKRRQAVMCGVSEKQR